MNRTQVADSIEYIEPDSMKNFTGCAGIIVSGGPKIFIDTNLGSDNTGKLIEQEKPDIAILSHYHLDHSTWGEEILAGSDADVFVPVKEESYFSDLDGWIQGMAGHYGMAEKWDHFVKETVRFGGIRKFDTYKDSSEFTAGDITIKCMETPGHSPGHMSFHFPKEKILFTGDMGIDRFGPWYGWIDCDLLDFVNSIFKLKSMQVDTLLTSHGGIITENIHDEWDNVLSRIVENERFIVRSFDSGKSGEEIAEEGVLYKKKSSVSEPLRSFLHMWDTAMLDQHIKVLDNGTSIEKYIKSTPQIVK